MPGSLPDWGVFAYVQRQNFQALGVSHTVEELKADLTLHPRAEPCLLPSSSPRGECALKPPLGSLK